MNRLTEKNMLTKSDLYCMEIDCELDTVAKWHNKLSQLEDIEEELGIDLITLFKALKNGVYYFTIGGQLTKDYVWLVDNYISIAARDKLSYSFRTAFEGQTLLFQDYGKTWALDKQTLEKH